MRILLTGSSGLIGTVLEAALKARGHEVVPFDVVADGADIRDGERMARAAAGVDGIMHLAAISRVAWGESHPALTDSVNGTGTQVVIDTAFAQPSRPWLLFASSREVYGNPPARIIDEDAPIAPLNVYGRSKAAGERIVDAARAAGLTTAMVRLSNVYGGRRDHPDRAVPALIADALAGRDLTITGADNYFDFVHVDDTVTGLIAAMDMLAGGETRLPPIHLATGIATSLGELADLAIATTGSSSRVVRVAPRAFDVSGFCGSPERAGRILGWQPQVTLAEGAARVAANLRDEGPLPAAAIPDALLTN